jgi:hypothetical protein
MMDREADREIRAAKARIARLERQVRRLVEVAAALRLYVPEGPHKEMLGEMIDGVVNGR